MKIEETSHGANKSIEVTPYEDPTEKEIDRK